MRREKQEIKDRAEIDAIIARARVCRLGMASGDKPYIVPMCFGYDGKHLYFHSAKQGRKIDMLKANDKVCFEFDECGELETSEKACSFGIEYKSIIGSGKASFIEDQNEKKKALDAIMAQYAKGSFEYPPNMLASVAVIKVDIEEIVGKRSS